MDYTRREFKTGEVLTAEALNHLEDGIALAMTSGGGVNKTTYAELKALRDAGQLKAGAFYRITDYVTATIQENTQSAGHQFDVIVLALDGGRLSEKAWAAHHEGDEYFKNSNLSAWQIWYCLDNDENRFVWAAPADGLLKKYALVKYGYSSFTAYHDASLDTEANGKKLYGWRQGGGPGQIGYSDTLDITSDSKVYTSSGDEDSSASFLVDVTEAEKGRGVIYRLIDEWGNDIAYDFKNIQYFVNDEWVYTFSEASELTGESYSNVVKPYYDSKRQKLNRILFGYGNFCNSFGVGCNYNTLGGRCHNNTFGNFCGSNTIGDTCHSNTFGGNCENNSLGNNCTGNTFGNNCLNNDMGGNCQSNTFGNSCVYNTFDAYCSYNIFGNDCYSNSFSGQCNGNTFGNSCSSNTFSGTCQSNTFGNSCKSNNFGIGCQSNSFSDGCSEAQLGNNNSGKQAGLNSNGEAVIKNLFD